MVRIRDASGLGGMRRENKEQKTVAFSRKESRIFRVISTDNHRARVRCFAAQLLVIYYLAFFYLTLYGLNKTDICEIVR